VTDPQSAPGKEESNVDPVVRWIPYVPLGAALIVLGTYVIYAAILMQAV
jgi:hypothetical protein